MTDSELSIQKLFDLTGRVAAVTGAMGYLGSAMSRALAEAGASVVALDIDQKRTEEFAAGLPVSNGAKHYGFALDIMDMDSIEERFAELLKVVGKVDILVNNAIEWADKSWSDITPEQFTRHQANSTSYFILARLVRNAAVKCNIGASIVMMGSMYGMVASYPDAYEGISPPSSVAYHALKGGVINMVRHLGVYWAKDNIRVNCISPGPFPQTKAPLELVERLCKKSPIGRVGQSYELKGSIVFLASDASSYMTGHNLIVDGGWTAW